MRDIIGGGDDVKRNARRYVPQGKMDDDSYREMMARAEFFPAASRTLDGVHGLIFSKPPTVPDYDKYTGYLENIDGGGNGLYKFMSDAVYDMMITGWGGVLVDAPNNTGVSQKAAEDNNLTPYCVYYKAENIINVRTKAAGRAAVLELVVLVEKAEEPLEGDPYSVEEKTRYRVLSLDEDGRYCNRLYDEDLTTVLSESYPTKNNGRLSYIPFYLKDTEPPKPMFKDIADVNIGHFQLMADYRNGLHWTAVPTPYVIGFVPEEKTEVLADGSTVTRKPDPIRIGGSCVNYFPEGTTAFNYLEFGGSGLSQLSSAITAAEERMAILGARIISYERRGVEAAETARIHRAAENSVVAAFTAECSKLFTAVVREYLEWCQAGDVSGVSVALNTDYDVSKMSAAELAALVACWQSGGISKKVLFYNMKNGEVVPADTDFEDMQNDIDHEGTVGRQG